jgi:hypothetical protein
MKMRLIIFLLMLVLGLLPFQASQSAATPEDGPYLFVEIETVVHLKDVETDSDHPEERRWYFSNVIVQPDGVPTYSLKRQRFIPYFSRNVMDPAEKRGVLIDYGEQDVRLNGESSRANYATRAEAEEERNKAIEYRKGQGGNIYSFEINFDNPQGEETSKPKLIHRDKEKPHYDKVSL